MGLGSRGHRDGVPPALNGEKAHLKASFLPPPQDNEVALGLDLELLSHSDPKELSRSFLHPHPQALNAYCDEGLVLTQSGVQCAVHTWSLLSQAQSLSVHLPGHGGGYIVKSCPLFYSQDPESFCLSAPACCPPY